MTQTDVQFSDHKEEAVKVAKRYEEISGADKDREYQRLNLVMDLTAADGVNGNTPLDWGRLLAADDANFLHDVAGISRHIDRVTGQLIGQFLPRYAKSKEAASQ